MRLKYQVRRDATSGEPKDGASGGGGGGAAGGAEGTPAALTRPDTFPEDLWDATANTPNYGAITEQLTAARTAQEAAAAGVITDAATIDWSIPGDLDPDSPETVYSLNADDPMVQALAPVFVEQGMKQPQISALTAAFARFQVSETKALRDTLKAEEAKLGDKMPERLAGAQSFIERALVAAAGDDPKAKEAAKARAQNFRNTWVTAEQVMVVEALMKFAGGPQAAPGGGSTGTDDTNKGRTFYGGMQNKEGQ